MNQDQVVKIVDGRDDAWRSRSACRCCSSGWSSACSSRSSRRSPRSRSRRSPSSRRSSAVAVVADRRRPVDARPDRRLDHRRSTHSIPGLVERRMRRRRSRPLRPSTRWPASSSCSPGSRRCSCWRRCSPRKMMPARARGDRRRRRWRSASPPVALHGQAIPADALADRALVLKEMLVGLALRLRAGRLFAAVTAAGSLLDTLIGFSLRLAGRPGHRHPVGGRSSPALLAGRRSRSSSPSTATPG